MIYQDQSNVILHPKASNFYYNSSASLAGKSDFNTTGAFSTSSLA
jgi:hypothetical protein